jgi:hypothetical protein
MDEFTCQDCGCHEYTEDWKAPNWFEFLQVVYTCVKCYHEQLTKSGKRKEE